MQMEDDQLQYDSLQTLDYLRDYFGLPEGLPEQLTRDTLGIRYSLFLKRYQQFQSVTIATVPFGNTRRGNIFPIFWAISAR